MIGAWEKSNKNELIEPGDVVCIDKNGLAKKVENSDDLLRVIGICTNSDIDQIIGATEEEINKGIKVLVGLVGTTYAKTNDKDIQAGDLLVAEIDGTVRTRNATDDDLDVLGMAMKKPENGMVYIKIK